MRRGSIWSPTTDRGHGYQAHLHDPLAAAVALDPQLVDTRQATVDVETDRDPDPRHDSHRLVRNDGVENPTR